MSHRLSAADEPKQGRNSCPVVGPMSLSSRAGYFQSKLFLIFKCETKAYISLIVRLEALTGARLCYSMHSYECQCNPDILQTFQSIYMATAYYSHQYQDMYNNLLFNPPFLHVAAIVSATI